MVQPFFFFQRHSLRIYATLVSYLLRDVLYFDISYFFNPCSVGNGLSILSPTNHHGAKTEM